MVRRIRTTLIIIVALLTSSCWLITYFEVANMGLLMRLGVPMSVGMGGSANIISFLAFTGMWVAMMLAMMLPSIYPTLFLHRTVSLKTRPATRWSTLCFASGYFFTWTLTGTIFYLAYVAIEGLRKGADFDQLLLRSAGVMLAVCGLYQWSRLKEACLRHCQSPMHFVLTHWRAGRGGAFRMGTEHGLYCFGCCWGLMVILFIMGVMNLAWMAAIGTVILLEKFTSAKWVPQAVGLVFGVLGTAVALYPSLLPQLSSHVTIVN